MGYAEVAVNAGIPGRETFSYALPPGMDISPGQAVLVPFGDRLLQGIVIELTEIPSVPEVRPIESVLDAGPILTPYQIELARWLSRYYLSPIFDAVSPFLPPGFERKAKAFLSLTERAGKADVLSLNERQRQVLDALKQGEIPQSQLEKQMGKKAVQDAVSQLVRMDFMKRRYELAPVRVKPKYETYVRLAVSPEDARTAVENLKKKRASKRAELLECLINQGRSVSLREIKTALNTGRAIASALEEKGLISFEEVRIRREPVSLKNIPKSEALALTPAQKNALDNVVSAFEQSSEDAASKVFLLHGVTGSGKTEVYLQALSETIIRGKKGIVLVPEISLTPQTVERFAARFPGRIAVLHSRLSLGEQYDEWERIKNGECDVVIGPRSALFAPQPDLGLIVIDEEHDPAYKQQDIQPYYHARDVALKLAKLAGAVVVMGSATPDVATFYYAQRGRYKLLTLPERVTPREGSPLPRVSVIDMREELKAGSRNLLSRVLSDKMAKALSNGEQIILFLNRRGASTFVQCQHCGNVLRCPRCETALNYHSAEEMLICHQCNYRMGAPPFCPRCRSRNIVFLGSGIQKLEQEVRATFPGYRAMRWDSDVTKGRHAHEEILAKFRAHGADILIGTQVVASGLDLPQVTLVGIVSADSQLNLPDFRAGEKTFQLLCQVSGRAGRGSLGGEVVLQTYSPDHYAVKTAASYDYKAFYEKEIDYRRKLRNPPFSYLASLTYSNTNEAVCRREVERMKRLIILERDAGGITGLSIIGPAPAFVPRLRGRYRWQLILRYAEMPAFVSRLTFGRGWNIDIDPVGLT